MKITTSFYNELIETCKASIAYDDAIKSCADEPEKMASFCTAEGDDLDVLYFNWQQKAHTILEKIKST